MFTQFITVYLISLCLFFVCTLRVRLIKSKLISLFFNLLKINVGHMLNFKRHLRGFSRLMIGLFAVQVLAAGFCLVTPEVHAAKAHAMDMQMPMSDDMASHCESNVKAESDHAGHSACAHWDSRIECPFSFTNQIISPPSYNRLRSSDWEDLTVSLANAADAHTDGG